jgi:hypothetical protein
MKSMHGLLVAIVACVTVFSARAEDIVLVSSPIPYATDGAAPDDVRKECDWNTAMPRYLAKESDGRVKVAEQSIDAMTDKKLTLIATNLHTAGGGGMSGPKWLALTGELQEGGKLLGNFEARRQTMRGSMRGCGTLNSLSEDVAKDILKWLKAPSLNAKLGDAK